MNTHHRLKLLALVFMTVDHLGGYLFPDMLWLRALGRPLVPVWFFLVGHALHYRVSPALTGWALALLLANAFLGGHLLAANALVTIIVCLVVLQQVEKRQWLARETGALCAACVLLILPSSMLMEYGTLGVLYALMGYAVRSGQMAWRTGKAVALVALVSFVGLQLVRFDFTLPQQVFVVLATSAVTWHLARFTHRPLVVPWRWQPVAAAGLYLSRHSMQYYVIHRVVLQGLAVLLGVVVFGWKGIMR